MPRRATESTEAPAATEGDFVSQALSAALSVNLETMQAHIRRVADAEKDRAEAMAILRKVGSDRLLELLLKAHMPELFRQNHAITVQAEVTVEDVKREQDAMTAARVREITNALLPPLTATRAAGTAHT